MKNEIFPTSKIKFRRGIFRIFKKRTSSTMVRRGGFMDEFPVGDDLGNHNDDVDKNFIGSSMDKNNLTVFLVVVLVLLSFLFIKSGYLQLVKGEFYLGVADGNRIKTKAITARRGVIYDKNKKQLVYNRPNFFLIINPREFFLNKKDNNYNQCLEDEDFCKNSKIKMIKIIFFIE